MSSVQVHFLDVGKEQFGECILCTTGEIAVLIDGAHPGDHDGSTGHESIPDQLATLLDQPTPLHVSLLVVTHAHEDHIGCLPTLVRDGTLKADVALLADPKLGWGRPDDHVPERIDVSNPAALLAAALREEVRDFRTQAEFARFLLDLEPLEKDYHQMIDDLGQAGTRVVRFGRDDTTSLEAEFEHIGLRIIGPSQDHLERCAKIIAQHAEELSRHAQTLLDQDPAIDLLAAYRRLTRPGGVAFELSFEQSAAVNLQSLLLSLEVDARRCLFTGDMQFTKPGVGDIELKKSVTALRQAIKKAAPFGVVKIGHHGSNNAFDHTVLDELGTETIHYGICTGESGASHPHKDVLADLKKAQDRIIWVRTDRNGRSTFTLSEPATEVFVSTGVHNDSTPS
jgi:beta-lactamase superfamily II metal-dependent hydrolase